MNRTRWMHGLLLLAACSPTYRDVPVGGPSADTEGDDDDDATTVGDDDGPVGDDSTGDAGSDDVDGSSDGGSSTGEDFGPVCGNGFLEPGEECDDGNLVDADGCEADCSAPSCDNGIVDPGEFCHAFAEEWALVESRMATAKLDDYDGDGNIDVAAIADIQATLDVVLSDGAGALTPLAPHAIANGATAIAAADFDGDDTIDIVTAHFDDALWLHPGVGDGTFAEAVLVDDAYTHATLGLYVADLDGDGTSDLATLAPDGRSILTQLSAGDGTFSALEIPIPGELQALGFAIADFDGDDLPDLALSQSTSPITSHLTLLRGTGAAAFEPAFDEAQETGVWWTMLAADADSDGNLDIVGGSVGDGLVLAMGDGAGGFSVTPPTAIDGILPQFLQVAHLNGDQWLDVVVGFDDSVRLTIALGREDLSFNQHFFNFGEVAGIGIGEFNGDGIDEIVVAGHQWGEDRVRLLLSTP